MAKMYQERPYEKKVSVEEYKRKADEWYEKYNIEGIRKGKNYSDVVDDEGYQYVNLIQEGGGVWGIALVGFTYILEKAGIRFLKMAGTSAGAINTALLASMPNPTNKSTKSEKLLELLSNLQMFNFVDGHWVARKLISNLITTNGYPKQVAFSLKVILPLCLILLLVGNIFQWDDINLNRLAIVSFALIVFLGVVSYYRGKKQFKQNSEKETGDDLHKIVSMQIEQENEMNGENIEGINKNNQPFWKYLSIAFSIFLVLFSLEYLFQCQKPACIQHIDLGIIFLLIITVVLMYDKFDRDLIAIGCLLFILLPVFAFGLSSMFIFELQAYNNCLIIAGLSLIILPFLVIGEKHRWMFYAMVLTGITLIFMFLATYFQAHQYSKFSYISMVAVMLFTLLASVVGGLIWYLFKKFNDNEFGINPGNYFWKWVKEVLKGYKKEPYDKTEVNDFDLEDLEKIWVENAANIQLRLDRKPDNECGSTVEDLKRWTDLSLPISERKYPITIISSELNTQNKAEFPRMKDLYWKQEDKVNVADFVRASMAIPFFFEPYRRLKQDLPDLSATVKDVNKDPNGPTIISVTIKDLWYEFFEAKVNSLETIHFVDGGVLSNFPFNIYHNPAIKNSRLPTFGIRLDDSSEASNLGFSSLFHYIGTLFNTTRYYYDRDFLLKNPYYRQCITTIDMKGHNWLNFFLLPDEKIKMFEKGAEAACEFLQKFDWEKFQKERNEGVDKLCNCKPTITNG